MSRYGDLEDEVPPGAFGRQSIAGRAAIIERAEGRGSW
jgi:hypothetical protein